jgi:hypothetical protein
MSNHFAVQRQALDLHRKSIEDEVPIWNSIALKIKPGRIDSAAFTNDGIRIGLTYNDIVDDYSWYVWRVGKILEGLAATLEVTVQNYGKAEEIIVDDVNKLGEQF